MTKKEMMRHIASLHEIEIQDREAEQLEFKVMHARIDNQMKTIEIMAELLTGVIPEDQRRKIVALTSSKKVPWMLSRLHGAASWGREQAEARLAELRAIIERMPDE